MHVIYIDIAKAFHEVEHGRICHHLGRIGAVGKLRECLHEFVKDRSLAVQVNEKLFKQKVIASIPGRRPTAAVSFYSRSF